MTITKYNCQGQCCRHTRHLGVCAHQRKCAHHATEAAQQAKNEEIRDWLAEASRAASLNRTGLWK